MKKLLILVLLLVFVLGFGEKVSLIRLEVVNKTPFLVNVELKEVEYGSDPAQYYYLPVEADPFYEAGSKNFNTKLFTLVRGQYKAFIYACGNPEPSERDLDLSKNFKLTVVPCGVAEEFEGDGVLKFSSLLDQLEEEVDLPDLSNARY